MTTATINLDLQDTLGQVFGENATWLRHLESIIAWEQAHEAELTADPRSGWTWQEVSTPTHVLNKLLTEQIIRLTSQSHRFTRYCLTDRATTEEFLSGFGNEEEVPPVDVKSLFRDVVGHERAKKMLRLIIEAHDSKTGKPRRAGALLVGPPGSAKSALCEDIQKLPGSHYYSCASSITRSGIVSFVLSEKPRFLILDELDKIDRHDIAPLHALMESGVVTRLQAKSIGRVTLTTKVFATANETRPIPAAILSRFMVLPIPGYSPETFLKIVPVILRRKYGYGPILAGLIARAVVLHSTDVRDAQHIADIINGDPDLVPDVVRALWPASSFS